MFHPAPPTAQGWETAPLLRGCQDGGVTGHPRLSLTVPHRAGSWEQEAGQRPLPKIARGSGVGPLGTSLLAGGQEGVWGLRGLLLWGVPPEVKEDPEGNETE